MRRLPTVEDEYKADPAPHYRNHHEAEVIASLRAGRPVVAVENDTYVIFAWDGGDLTLLGRIACKGELEMSRLGQFPWVVIVLGEPAEPMDRRQGDAEAMDYAIRLGRDEVDLRDEPGKSTGRRSWELWAEQLADEELAGPHFYHANVLGHLRSNRKAAAAYLRTMSTRHKPPASEALTASASVFDEILAKLHEADTGKEPLSTEAGRQRLISLIRQAMDLEAKAQDRMGEALRRM